MNWIFLILSLILSCKSQPENVDGITTNTISSPVASKISNCIIHGFGEAYPKFQKHRKFGVYQTFEVYTQASTGKLILGVEKIGPFRLYTTQEFESDSSYRNQPRIESIENGTVLNIINPIEE